MTFEIPPADIEVFKQASRLETGGMRAFTSYMFADLSKKPRWDLVGVRIDLREGLGFDKATEYVPWVPLDWQFALAHATQMDSTIIGGMGTTDLDTRIYEADMGCYVTMRWLIEHNHAPVVLSKTPTGWAHVRATVPYLEGSGPMVRVTFESGRVLDCGTGHRLLTTQGYVHTGDLSPGAKVVSPRSLGATVHSDVLNVPCCSETASSFPESYSQDFHRCDEPPLPVQAACQSLSPLQAGVHKPSRLTAHGPDSLGGEAPFSVQAVLPRNPHLSRPDSNDLFVLHAEPGVPRRWHATSDVLARPEQADLELSSSGGKTNQYWQDVSRLGCIDLAPKAFSCDENGQVEWLYHVGKLQNSGLSDELQETLQPLLVFRTCPQELESSLVSTMTNLYDYPSLPPSDSDWWDYTTLDTVVSIEELGERDYYDLHVPLYNNYVAEGAVSHNCSKTVGAAVAGIYWCCMLPSFRFLGCGPTSYQASQMHEAVRTELLDWKRRDEVRRPIHKYVKKIVDRPWPRIEFWNGSTMEFMSGDQQGQKILTWSGDVVVVDQAESFENLEKLLENLGTRTRGIVQDRERLGKLILLANAEYHPALWERFDMGLANIAGSMPEHYLSILLTTYDNPYLSKDQVSAFERRIADPERRRQLLLSERPIPRGKEFTPTLLEPAQDSSMDENMAHQLREGTAGYSMQTMRRAGTWLWETPYNELCEYIVTGDPGQGCPPFRNSPCIIVFNVTDFPDREAELAAFWWGDGKGSYWPFIYKFEEYCQIYKPRAKGFDATGTQKGFNELVFQQRGIVVEGLNMQKWKMQMVVTLKLLLGKKLIRMPKGIQGIWMQLAGWHMPDKKLRQDIASTLFMAAFLINRLYRISDDDSASDVIEGGEDEDRYSTNRILHPGRHERLRR